MKNKFLTIFNCVMGALLPFFLVGACISLALHGPLLNSIVYYLHVPFAFLFIIFCITYRGTENKAAREALHSLTTKEIVQLVLFWPLIMTQMFWSSSLSDFKSIFKKVENGNQSTSESQG